MFLYESLTYELGCHIVLLPPVRHISWTWIRFNTLLNCLKNVAMISAASQQLPLQLLTDPNQFYRAEAENLSKPHRRRRKYLEAERGQI